MEKIINILKDCDALLEGHFLLSSGKHSNRYVQCAKLLRFPDKSQEVLKVVVDKIKDFNIDIVLGPAMGGVVVAYEIGRQLNKESIFTERVDNIMTLRRGFEINKGDKVIITEDVVTTGKSTLEVKKIVEEMGAEVIGVACIVDRTIKDIGIPIYSVIKLDIEAFDATDCPMCKEQIEIVKPGSRKFQ